MLVHLALISGPVEKSLFDSLGHALGALYLILVHNTKGTHKLFLSEVALELKTAFVFWGGE